MHLFFFNYFWFILCLHGIRTAAAIVVRPSIDDPDIYKNVSELITSKGYPLVEHSVQTADGYILSLQRIPHGRSNSVTEKKGTILLIHGIATDASSWLLNLPDQSLGFVLPDSGYDVWLINTRGCTYSRKHIIYSTHDNRFWDFSFDEVAQYDIPATIDYILDITGKEDLYVIAISQGCSATFAMLSEIPDYNDKIKLFIALAPVTSVGYITSIIPRLKAPFAYFINEVVQILFAGEFLPSNTFTKAAVVIVCTISPDFCESLLFSLLGMDREQLNQTRLNVYFSHFPAPTSAKSLVHYAQSLYSKKFRKYDYMSRNLEYYNQEEPPEYDLTAITTPVALFWSTNDKFADTVDVDILRSKLNSVDFDYQIPYHYSHLDFIAAENSPQLINEPVLQLLDQY